MDVVDIADRTLECCLTVPTTRILIHTPRRRSTSPQPELRRLIGAVLASLLRPLAPSSPDALMSRPVQPVLMLCYGT